VILYQTFLKERNQNHEKTMSVDDLRRIGCVIRKEDEFVLKSGQRSNLYIDLRRLTAHPKILRDIAEQMSHMIPTNVDFIAGIVAGGIPMAVMFSQVTEIPMLMIRTERKLHGTGRWIEGWSDDEAKSQKRHNVLLVEDVINTGGSAEETIRRIQEANEPVNILGCVCVLNRGTQTQLSSGVPIYSLWTLKDFEETTKRNRKSFSDREKMSKDPFAKRIFRRMSQLETNLIWSADVQDSFQLLHMLDIIAPHLAAVKVHFDSFETFDEERFQEIVERHDLPVISDRKYADIRSTVFNQIRSSSLERLASSATVHSIAGSGSVDALNHFAISSILVVEMSNVDTPFLEGIGAYTVAMAKKHSQSVGGFICQSREACEAGDEFLYMTPGVHLEKKKDGFDQRYRTCHQAIQVQGNDLVIVGRGIHESGDFLEATKKYRINAWSSL
jgi:orotidine 5'-phosphate decarboxylase subfamily 1/orotate phosphoribosyltransferase